MACIFQKDIYVCIFLSVMCDKYPPHPAHQSHIRDTHIFTHTLMTYMVQMKKILPTVYVCVFLSVMRGTYVSCVKCLSLSPRTLLTRATFAIYVAVCVAVCCSLLRCVAVCCGVLQSSSEPHTGYVYIYTYIGDMCGADEGNLSFSLCVSFSLSSHA